MLTRVQPTRTSDRAEPVPIVEFKLGALWTVDLRRSAFFLQTTWVGQRHFDVIGSAGPGDATVEGLNLALGLKY